MSPVLPVARVLVTRDELRATCWPADTFVDFDLALHNAIARIREVLADSADATPYIETLPRRGYRFIAAVEEAQALPLVTTNGRRNGHGELNVSPQPITNTVRSDPFQALRRRVGFP